MATVTTDEKSRTEPVRFRQAALDIGGQSLRYLEAGEGPPLVYLHGGAGLRLSLAHQTLAAKRRLIALEMPGFGAAASEMNLGDIAGILHEAVAALGVTTFDLVGHDVGATVALRMAMDRPDALNALVLVAPTTIRPETPGPMARATVENLSGSAAAVWFAETPSAQAAQRHRDMAARLMGKPRDAEFEARMAEVAKPVLTLFGTSDSLVSTEAARLYSGLLPKNFAVMVYDAGHDLEFDRPEAAASVIENFLTNRESFVINRDGSLINP